jgi:hypothetical protein
MFDERRRLACRSRRYDEQIRRLGMFEWLGRHEESGPGTHLMAGADHRHVPGGRGLVDLSAQCVGVVQHVEDCREPGVEDPVIDDECYLHDGNGTNHVVSAADALSGRHRRFVVRRRAGVVIRGVTI